MIRFLFFMLCSIVSIDVKAQFPTLNWAVNVGGIWDDYVTSMVVDAHGNTYSTGLFKGICDFDPSEKIFNLIGHEDDNFQRDIFISKIDAQGNFVWARNFGDTFNEYGSSIAVDANGNIYVSGTFKGTVDFNLGPDIFNLRSNGKYDIFVLKLDNNGEFKWAKKIGGKKSENKQSFAIDKLGNFYITGYFSDTLDFDPDTGVFNMISSLQYSDQELFISKFDSSGNFIWARQLKGKTYCFGNSIAIDLLDNIFITGNFIRVVDFDPGTNSFEMSSTLDETSDYTYDVFITKWDGQGNFIWAIKFEGDNESFVRDIVIDNLGNVFTTGSFKSMVDFDPGPNEYKLFAPTIGFDYEDIFVAKLTGNGLLLWAKNMGGLDGDVGDAIAVDDAGNSYVAGFFYETVDFDPGPGHFNLTSGMVILKMDALGNFVWARRCGGGSNSGAGASAIRIDKSDNLYVAGGFYGKVDFNFGTGVFELECLGEYNADIYILKMSQKDITNANVINVYPNPNNGAFRVTIGNAIDKIMIEIYTNIGALIFKRETNLQTTSIDLSAHANGLYFVKIVSGNSAIVTQKIVKQ